ncbi:MAG: hypothetical protein ACYTG7_09455, partial [Planctomycetota bacterium]
KQQDDEKMHGALHLGLLVEVIKGHIHAASEAPTSSKIRSHFQKILERNCFLKERSSASASFL